MSNTNNIPVELEEEYQAAALLRLRSIYNLYCSKHIKILNVPFKDEATFLQHTISILNMLSPWLWYQRNDAKTVAGYPDIIYCLNGRFVALELKDDEGNVSAPQRKNLNKIIAAMGIAVSIKTLKQVFLTLYACFGEVI